ncbi:S-adenosyl-L-methionine-dependent methyltransferase [Chaetomium fimeti]|uniref:S-adenosyl-L-methionine-dependent methyltransferase n=1 Tax=Chaetomium fimeti TaxID=1854472 RepID=A0AAE0LNF9_9PEZI|nr:S-adenosyl-L-methionine-dependent methyltransferase [Chaetomium fimeti]
MSTVPTSSLSARAVASWEDNAAYWDSSITKHGNKYWKRLQEPSLARLIGPSSSPNQKPDPNREYRALELATGNGLCARWLAHRGASVLATDACENMLALAKGHCEPGTVEESIRFRRVDVTSEEELGALAAEGPFDVVLLNMAAMDIADLAPLAKKLSSLLEVDGVFVATVLHPVFFTSNATRSIEVGYSPVTGECEIVRGKLIKEYMSVPPAVGIAIPGQPVKQVYFHRPIHELFGIFFNAGLVMDAMEELAFTEEDAEDDRIESSSNYTQLPAILSFRMRLP